MSATGSAGPRWTALLPPQQPHLVAAAAAEGDGEEREKEAVAVAAAVGMTGWTCWLRRMISGP